MSDTQPQSAQNADPAQDVVEQAMAEVQESLNGVAQAVDDEPTLGAEEDRPDDGAIELLSDVELNVTIELGRTQMLVEDVLRLAEGSVVELDKLAGDPVDVYVNRRLVARGEVLVLNDNFCIRINEIVDDLQEQAEAAAQQQATHS